MGLAALDLVALAPPPPTADAAASLDGSELIGSDLERWLTWQCSIFQGALRLFWAPPGFGAITGASVTGLRFDSWTERIPSSVEKPAVAFHYAEPSARAPQTLLLALAPPNEDNWNAQLMLATVLEVGCVVFGA
jgi:hypothetical protein